MLEFKYLSTISMASLGNYKDNYDRATTKISMGFDKIEINNIFIKTQIEAPAPACQDIVPQLPWNREF